MNTEALSRFIAGLLPAEIRQVARRLIEEKSFEGVVAILFSLGMEKRLPGTMGEILEMANESPDAKTGFAIEIKKQITVRRKMYNEITALADAAGADTANDPWWPNFPDT